VSKLYVDEILPSSTSNVSFTQGGTSNYISPSYVGELKSFRIRRTTSVAFPFWNLSLPDQTLSAGTYPDYVDYLRSIKLETCSPTLLTGNVSTSGNSTTITFASSQTLTAGSLLYFHSASQFRIILSGSTTSYVVDEPITLSSQAVSIIDQSNYSSTFSGAWSTTAFTLTDNAQNKILLDALTEDAYYTGASISSGTITPINTTNWLILRWGTTDINITSFNPTTRVLNVASGSPTGTTIELYPHRISGSVNAYHKQVDDSVLINNGIQVINGLRLRDRIQGHRHSIDDPSHRHAILGQNDVVNDAYPTMTGPGQGWIEYTEYATTGITVREPSTDTVNGTPRTGQFTRPRGLGIYFYEYMGRIST